MCLSQMTMLRGGMPAFNNSWMTAATTDLRVPLNGPGAVKTLMPMMSFVATNLLHAERALAVRIRLVTPRWTIACTRSGTALRYCVASGSSMMTTRAVGTLVLKALWTPGSCARASGGSNRQRQSSRQRQHRRLATVCAFLDTYGGEC